MNYKFCSYSKVNEKLAVNFNHSECRYKGMAYVKMWNAKLLSTQSVNIFLLLRPFLFETKYVIQLHSSSTATISSSTWLIFVNFHFVIHQQTPLSKQEFRPVFPWRGSKACGNNVSTVTRYVLTTSSSFYPGKSPTMLDPPPGRTDQIHWTARTSSDRCLRPSCNIEYMQIHIDSRSLCSRP